MTDTSSALDTVDAQNVTTDDARQADKWPKPIFWVCAVLMLLIMVNASQDYGVNWDEKILHEYGEKVLAFYESGGRDRRSLDENVVDHRYGGLVEVLCVMAGRISGRDIYDTRHFIVSCFGFLAVLFTGLTAAQLAGWRTGIAALLFAFLTPVFFGHAMHNSKDIPFASAYIASIYFLSRFLEELPNARFRTIAFLVLSIAIAINIRVGGVLLIGYLLVGWSVQTYREVRRGGVMKSSGALLRKLPLPVGMTAGAYLLGMALWPYGLTNPIMHPFEALRGFSQFNFDSYNLFGGRWIHQWEIPWSYLPTWIAITTPPFISLGSLFIPLLFVLPRARDVLRAPAAHAGLMLATAILPLVFIIINSSNVYDGWRHVLFVYPPLALMCAVAWMGMIAALTHPAAKAAGTIALGVVLLQPAVWMLRNHPFESFYFSPLIGGGRGAFGRYEIDYYGTSIRQAVEWIAAHSEGTSVPARVRSYYGDAESAKHFVDKYGQLQYVVTPENSTAWDYSIVLPVEAKYNPALLQNWPPKGTVHEGVADNAPIFAIVKNYRASAGAPDIASIAASNDLNYLINSSASFFNAGDYASCIAVCDRVLKLAPANVIALNNKCSALNQLSLYADAAEACQAGLQVDPSFTLIQNNYKETLSGKAVSPGTLAVNYINLSLAYYRVSLFDLALKSAQRALDYDAASYIAYNNICAAYNSMGDYKSAEDACTRGLAINPAFELLRNNLRVARENRN